MLIKIDIPIPPVGQNMVNVPVHYCGGHVVDAGGYGFEECKIGKWIRVNSNTFKCSLCGNFLNFRGVNAGRGDANYCPNCGKKLEKEE